MAVSKAQQKAVAKYNSKAYDEIKVRVFKGSKEVISNYAASQGKSTNKLINELLEDEIPQLKVLKENRTDKSRFMRRNA